mmetsp:Transcript_89342/g.288865  ORF Transcript_89342/g.288865 Transcript_89342/m.288865 type:complete len:247 (-) Transcript_89342:777-1517(-)
MVTGTGCPSCVVRSMICLNTTSSMKLPKLFVAEKRLSDQEELRHSCLAHAPSVALPKQTWRDSSGKDGFAHTFSMTSSPLSPAATEAMRKCDKLFFLPVPANSSVLPKAPRALAKMVVPSSVALPRTRLTSVKPHERRPEAATARQTSSPMTAFSRPNVVSAPPGIVASAGAAAELEDAEEAVLEAAFWAAATEEATVRTSSQASSSRNSVPPTTSSLSLLPAFPLCPPFTNRPRRVVPRPVSRLP